MKMLICTLVISYGSTFLKNNNFFFSFSTGIPVYSTQSVDGLWTCGLSAESTESWVELFLPLGRHLGYLPPPTPPISPLVALL